VAEPGRRRPALALSPEARSAWTCGWSSAVLWDSSPAPNPGHVDSGTTAPLKQLRCSSATSLTTRRVTSQLAPLRLN